MTERVYEFDKSEEEKLKKMLAYDPFTDPSAIPPSKDGASAENGIAKLAEKDKYYDVIFARQEYSLREGASVGLATDKVFLYLKANDEFFPRAEEKLKANFQSFKRASPEAESKLVAFIKEEQERSNEGFGMLFGG
ncbi:MAG: hypothetical protein ACP5RM_01175 [Candidatus Micrarchaeia archaeon]